MCPRWASSSFRSCIFVQDGAAMATYDAIEALRRPVLRPLRCWLDPWGMQAPVLGAPMRGGHVSTARPGLALAQDRNPRADTLGSRPVDTPFPSDVLG